MSLDGGRDENICLLFDPNLTVFYDVTGIGCGILIDGSIFIHDREQEARVNTILMTIGVRYLIRPIPT
jgi:hypothetical protein